MHAGSVYTFRMRKQGRNEPCACGSGRKFKKCCGQSRSALRAWPVPAPPPPDRLLGLKHVGTYMCFSEATGGTPLPAGELLSLFTEFDRAETFARFAQLAALLANDPEGSQAREFISNAIRELRASKIPQFELVADFLISQPSNRSIVHEKVLYFVEALTLLAGKNSGKVPKDALLAFCLLAANDYVSDWRESDTLATDAQLLADFTHLMRFNRGGDFLRDLVRAALMMEDPPERQPKLSSREAWEEFQRNAFGMTLSEYIDFVGALALQSQGWGVANKKGGQLDQPVIRPSAWLSMTRVTPEMGVSILREMSVTPDEAKSTFERERRHDGLPWQPTLFYRKPFIEAHPGVLVAASPWAVREQLHYGLWGRLLSAAKRSGKGGDRLWLSAFGDMFERWCRRVALLAKESAAFQGSLLLSKQIGGADEIADIVLVEGQDIILFSAKAGLLLEADAKGARSRQKIIDWLSRFLLDKRTSEHGEGAFVQLDRVVCDIKEGRHPQLSAGARIYPVVVTYEHIGEHPLFYRWLSGGLHARGLFQQSNVAPVAVISVGTFERLMSVAAHGASVRKILEHRGTIEGGEVSVSNIIEEIVPEEQRRRLAQIEDSFYAVVNRITVRLFDTPLKRS